MYNSGASQSPPSEHHGLSRARDWRLKMCWLPQRCFLSNQSLWGRHAYHGVRVITGPGEPIYENYWIEKHEFIIWNLKGN